MQLEPKNPEITVKDNEHIFHMWTPLAFETKKGYEYIKDSSLFTLFSNLIYAIIVPILMIANKMMFGLKIEGMEEFRKVKGGKVTVSNHIHPMDCTFMAIATVPTRVYFPTLEANFKIPVISKLIRLLYAIPIPAKMDARKEFVRAMDTLLKRGNTVHFYPEAAMWPYCDRIRKFKSGAFDFATKNDVPILPIVYTFREPDGIYRYYKKKKCITLTILPAMHPSFYGYQKSSLKEAVHAQMSKVR